MAKRSVRKVARGVSLSSQAAVKEAGGGESRQDPTTGFRIPSVRGMRPAVSSDPVDLEATRFTNGGTGAPFPSARRVSEAAIEAAQRRMLGVRIDPTPVEEGDDDDALVDEDAVNEPIAEAAPAPRRATAVQGRAFTMPVQGTAPAKPKQDGLSLAPVSIEAIDQLWDWLRQDADRGAGFFLQPPANSVQLHSMMATLTSEGQAGVVRAIHYYDKIATHHLGFVMLAPVLMTEGIAVLHVYLRKDVRPRLLDVSLDLMDDIAALVPGLQLAVYGSDVAWEPVLAKLGFTKHTMFVR